MHLKTLTLKGFKSFASATTLHLEPGVTCVVGPNGSGKSNVVDALAWVMGEQGAKTLRGGKMEDVIFAGTAGRPPLGRAEVSLTIDNTDGALPIEYTEVTITRTMFRAGGSEYSINGTPSRLLDVQELLSDSGIGREMHVIVGQGQLDAVLHATPQERRGFVEEAAGVLKHRKRREKALRKLDAMPANLTRVTDLTTELRRQLGPLGRQAQVARRAQVVQAEARDARARLLADELVQLTSTRQQEEADETALLRRREEVTAALAASRDELAGVEASAARAAPRLGEASDRWHRLSGLAERFRGTATLAAERVRLLGSPEDADAGRNGTGAPERTDVDTLHRRAAQVREQEAALAGESGRARERLEAAVAARAAAEDAFSAEERRLAAVHRAAADRREGIARLAGQVAARRSRVEAAEAEMGRLRATVGDADARGRAAQQQFAALESQVAGVEQGERGLDAEHEAAADALAAAEADVAREQERERAADRDRASLVARSEALQVGLARKDGAGALLAAADRLPGVLGSVAALLRVEPGYEAAVAAALGDAADAVAVESVDAAVDALRLLTDDDAGRAALLVGSAGNGPAVPPDDTTDDTAADTTDATDDGAEDAAGGGHLPAGARPLGALVSPAAALRPAVRGLLAGTVVVEGLDEARALVRARPDLVAVTTAGDLLGTRAARGGSASTPSLLEVQAAVDETGDLLAEAVRRGEQARFARQAAAARQQEAARRVADALDRLHESDARYAAVAEQLGALGSAARSARAEADRARERLAAAERDLTASRTELEDLSRRHAAAQAPATDGEDAAATEDPAERDRLAGVASAARASEVEARLEVRTVEERLRALSGRAESLENAAARELQAREHAARRAEQRRREVEVAVAVAAGCARALDVLGTTMASAAAARDEAERERAARQDALAHLRSAVDGLAGELAVLTDSAHRDEVARTQQRLRIAQLEERAVQELGIAPDVLVAEYGPDLPVPPVTVNPAPGDPAPGDPPPGDLAPGDPQPDASGTDGAGRPAGAPYVRAEQEARLRRAERAMAQLGRVNPLALEEYAALEERHTFLTEQLEDLRRSRKDLLDIVASIDARVEQVFAEAFADTAAQFETVFARLFPGGEGRLVLTAADDALGTGIDIEARPAGKKVKRLSLLSGGERSLTAVALLVSIFIARPSPFYVLDEIEAALDDANLGRLLGILTELRQSSQLVVVTHQKRTMEIADALYGVTMRGDGVTTVVSQRLRERQDA